VADAPGHGTPGPGGARSEEDGARGAGAFEAPCPEIGDVRVALGDRGAAEAAAFGRRASRRGEALEHGDDAHGITGSATAAP